MTWTKLSDDFADDCWTLSDTAFRLHVEGLTWSNRKLLDLRLPKDDVRRFAKHPGALAELLDGGWWRDDGEHYVIQHHAQYQRDRDAVISQQKANSENGKKGGRPRKPPREISTHGKTEPVSEPLSDSTTQRDRPGQDRSGSEDEHHETSTWPPVRAVGGTP